MNEPDGQTRRSRTVRFVSGYMFYGWVIAGLGFIAQMMTSLSIQGLATYVAPFQREFGWSHGATAAGRSFQQADAFMGPVNGWLVDRFGPRRMMSIGVFLYAAAFASMAFIETLTGFYVSCLLMALANSMIGWLVVCVSVNNWFRALRTTALGVAGMGFAVTGIVLLPLLVWVQGEFGWRAGAIGTAVVVLLFGVPILLLMRDNPESYGQVPDGRRRLPAGDDPAVAILPPPSEDFTLRQALGTRAFWLLAVGAALFQLAQSALIVHQFPYIERLVDRETAALILAEINIFSLIGRFAGGIIGDRYMKRKVMGFSLVACAIGIFMLAIGGGLLVLLIYGCLYGLSWGVRSSVMYSLTGDYFGRRSFGKIAGAVQTLSSPASILAPILIGVAIDRTDSYLPSLLALSAVTFLSSAMFLMVRRPRLSPPA